MRWFPCVKGPGIGPSKAFWALFAVEGPSAGPSTTSASPLIAICFRGDAGSANHVRVNRESAGWCRRCTGPGRPDRSAALRKTLYKNCQKRRKTNTLNAFLPIQNCLISKPNDYQRAVHHDRVYLIRYQGRNEAEDTIYNQTGPNRLP